MMALNRDSGELVWEVNAAAPTDPVTGTPSPKTQGFTGGPARDQDPRRQGSSWCRARAPAASSAREAGSAPWMSTPVNWRGAPSPSRRRVSRGLKLGRITITLGESAAAACGRPPPTIPTPTSCSTAPETRSRASIPSSGPATICSRRARSRSTPTPAKSSWYFQETPNEHWDFDTPSPKMLYEVFDQWRAAQGRRQFLAQRFLLHARPHQRPVPARRSISGEDHLDQGHRPEDR